MMSNRKNAANQPARTPRTVVGAVALLVGVLAGAHVETAAVTEAAPVMPATPAAPVTPGTPVTRIGHAAAPSESATRQPADRPDTRPTGPADRSATTVVFALRHAEKAADGRNPGLTPAGTARAAATAELLRDAAVDAVWSTPYRRTQETAAPIAARFGIEVQTYDPRSLGDLAADLRSRGGRHVVVGHSNTTPALVRLLGGTADPPIDDRTEFDRLDVVTIGPDGPATTVRLRLPGGPAAAGAAGEARAGAAGATAADPDDR